MQVASISILDDLKNKIYELLINRKNLISYDGLKDSLESNIYYKFFYSSPKDALEFINLDIYRKAEKIQIGIKYFEAYGIMNIITDKEVIGPKYSENIFGYLVVDDIKIRQVDKRNIKLLINRNGLLNIKSLINFFEDNL